MSSKTPPTTASLNTSSSSSDTLATFVTDYRMENGRRYHAYQDGCYWGPNDDLASEGQNLAHSMYCMTLGGLHLAPLKKNPQEILDVGTGTGIWAIEMADKFPDAQISGTDLSPIQPDLVPPNCVFEIDDATLEWTWDDNFFDFVHIRELFGSIQDWGFFLCEANRCTAPGGYVEIVEHSVWPVSDDGSVGPDHFLTHWGRTIEELGSQMGKSFRVWKDSKAMLQRAGFVDVVEKQYKWPINDWPEDQELKRLGSYNQARLLENIEGFTMRLLTSTGGWSVERAQVFLAEMRMAVKDTRNHAYQAVSVVYGRKPS